MIATISADIVKSTSLMHDDYIIMRKKLDNLIRKLEYDNEGFWARIVKGDGLECVVPDYRLALRISLLIKLFVKVQADSLDCSEMLKRHGIRFSIGIAREDYSSREDDVINGPAIYMSGRNLDTISRKNEYYSAVEIDQTSAEVNDFVDSYVSLLSNLTDTYSAKQAEVVYYKLQGMKEVQIAELLGIRQSSVNIRSTGASWNMMERAVEDFEHINFDRICG